MINKIFFSVVAWGFYLIGCYSVLWGKDEIASIAWFVILYIILYNLNVNKDLTD